MSSRSVPRWLTQWEYAHRGLHSASVPENSLEAARAAVDAGMGLECDIQRSSDNVPMVFHDWELDRLTQQSGPTDERTQAELEQFYLVDGESPIPSLNRYLKEISGAIPILIEIKSKPDYDVAPTCLGVHSELNDYSGDCAVMSFDPRVCEWFRANGANTMCGLVMREDEFGFTQTAPEREAAFARAKPDFLAYHVAALPNLWVEGLRENGLPVLTWTVNSHEARNTALLNADALICEGEGVA